VNKFSRILTDALRRTQLPGLFESIASYIVKSCEICTNRTTVKFNWCNYNIHDIECDISSGGRRRYRCNDRGRRQSSSTCDGCGRLLYLLANVIALEKEFHLTVVVTVESSVITVTSNTVEVEFIDVVVVKIVLVTCTVDVDVAVAVDVTVGVAAMHEQADDTILSAMEPSSAALLAL